MYTDLKNLEAVKNIDIESIPLAPEHCVVGFGTTLIVAPHAEDESLGCGGVISLLKKYGQKVFILLLTDGTLSHPASQAFSPVKLRELRENELINAAAILGVPSDHLIFCRFQDGSLPNNQSKFFKNAVQDITKVILAIQPQSIFVPWRRDPHPDHQAAFQIIAAVENKNAKIYEFPIGSQHLGEENDMPTLDEAMPFRLDISTVLENKMSAIAAHTSQTTELINEDPEGSTRPVEMSERWNRPYELFYISK